MRLQRWWTVSVLASCLAAMLLSGTTRAQARDDKANAPLDRKDLDAIIHKTLTAIINEGADLYNRGDREGCSRLWQGALMMLRPLLDHHPDLQRAVDEALRKADCSDPCQQAFALRAVLDRIRKETAPRKAKPASKLPAEKTLWDRLGGEKGVSRIVDTFLNLVRNDARVNFYRKPNYKPSDRQLETLKKQLVDFISSETGGPDKYKGKSMKEAHQGMGVTNAEFNAAADDLHKALRVHGVKPLDIDLLLSIVETTRSAIVQPAAPKPPAPTSRWQRLGGEAGVSRIVNEFVDTAIDDPQVNFFRDPKYKPVPETVRILKTKIVELISSLTGGPLKYKGMNMRAAHQGMGITNAQFDAFLGHVRMALVKNKVPAGDIKFLMDQFGEMRTQVVQMPTASETPPKPGP